MAHVTKRERLEAKRQEQEARRAAARQEAEAEKQQSSEELQARIDGWVADIRVLQQQRPPNSPRPGSKELTPADEQRRRDLNKRISALEQQIARYKRLLKPPVTRSLPKPSAPYATVLPPLRPNPDRNFMRRHGQR